MALTQTGTDGIKDDAITLAKQAAGTDGQIITYDASGNPVAVGPGTDGQVLTSTGAGSPPAFEAIPAAGAALTGSTDNTICTVTGANAIQGEANLTFDGSDLALNGGDITSINTGSGQTVTLSIGANSNSGVNDGVVKIINGGTGNGVLQWDYESSANRAQIYVYRSTQELIFTVGGNERARITDNGIKVPSGKGIDFSATSDASGMTSELLDDYEEGTWTPTLDNGNVTGYTSQVGTYTKVGNLVTAYFSVNANGGDTSLGSAHIAVGGLPFAAASGFQGGGLTVGYNDNFHNGRFNGMVQDGGSDIKLYQDNGTYLYWNEAGNPNNNLRGTIVYQAS
tara:strand:+ start:481 stop:1497 length:1017 start_codon:yes stop_codon:yes gene_type:complete